MKNPGKDFTTGHGEFIEMQRKSPLSATQP
jgi:hypothetical protein